MFGNQLGLERALHNGGAGANIATAVVALAYAVGVVVLLGRERELLAPKERWFGRDFGGISFFR